MRASIQRYSIVLLLTYALFNFSPQSLSAATFATDPDNLDIAELSTQMALTELDLPRKRWSPWSTSWFNWATQSVKGTREGVAQLSSYNYLSVNYRLQEATISVRPEFFISGAGENDFTGEVEEASTELGNIYFQYSKYNLALLPGGIGVTGAIRYYMPTSTLEKQKKGLGQIRGKFYLNKPWGRGWNSTVMLEPRYYMYKERGYIVDRGGYNTFSTNRWGQFKWYYEHSLLLNAHYGFSLQTGSNHEWTYGASSDEFGRKQSQIRDYWENAAYFLLNIDGVMLKIGLMQERDVRTPNGRYSSGEKFKLFNEEETKYSVMTYVRL